ncbi:hypothetical protein MJO28_010787 [Puccinia striiformis f. sp. tritici]|uniref:Hydrophobin n=4 Tax=Puccinia striiformis TaxID=27350 RepID=A0A0L0W1D5_9BASI|nr:hypothetical protein Pst134EA_019604 [Puccinia striiformis f. sp. tritici]KAI9618662.1 hypothetical protein KEM48_006641 [Puccinia striiformis f. sp. tritici PST-130]KNF05353.1 hypothetical protein PSTG_01569 [Puccinia striiformis f. sp. tritici PST-78]POW08832.1 hypothetical protein PSHT_09379 [Puccinia striiformis]KAH9449686.1 hypothetical protein Pst134EB_020503 [Puccinia striiformis f. sp. tritici]KAH9459451.1 hypothetical protein Pst134EA_019604 [Puccinia striiformis f. sp. tritici]
MYIPNMSVMVFLTVSMVIGLATAEWREYTKVDLVCTGEKTQALCSTPITTGYSVILATPVDKTKGTNNCVNARTTHKLCCEAETAPLNDVNQTPVNLSTETVGKKCTVWQSLE